MVFSDNGEVHDGLVSVYPDVPVSYGDIVNKNGILIQNGRYIDENDSIVVGNAVVFDLEEKLEDYEGDFDSMSRYISIEGYMNRIKHNEGYDMFPENSDIHKALYLLYYALETRLIAKYGVVSLENKTPKKSSYRKSEDTVL